MILYIFSVVNEHFRIIKQFIGICPICAEIHTHKERKVEETKSGELGLRSDWTPL